MNFKLTTALMLGASLAATAPVAAANYPEKPLTLIVPYPPGGGTDVLSRAMSSCMEEKLGQPIVIENRGGAGGTIGARALAQAEPDGYTFMVTPVAVLAVAPHTIENVGYDSLKFTPITRVALTKAAVAVHPDSGFKSVSDLVDYAKENPGALNFGSSGNGSMSHFFGVQFMALTGTEMVHVPYKGSAAASNDLIAGHIDLMFEVNVLQFVGTDKMDVLAMTSAERSPIYPDIPTMQEEGVEGYDMSSWYGIVAPEGLAQEETNVLFAASSECATDPETQVLMSKLGLEMTADSEPAVMGEVIQEAYQKFGKLVAESKK